GPYAFGVTYGMGHVAMAYFEDKDAKRESLKRVFENAVADAKKIFSREKLDEFRKKRGQEVTDFVNKVTGRGAKETEKAPPKRAKKKAPRRPRA
ncbi:MAG: hypothetical protein ACYC8T_02840, partial [Myxococcaceae bacterium]